MAKGDQFEEAKRTMGALVRTPPKHHDEMKLGKPRGKKAKSPAKRQRKSR
jgi:hypothetical protein